MLKRVAIIGPESTGKSTLAKDLAEALNTTFVPEYARAYIDQLDRPYQYEDLLAIAQGQAEQEDSWSNSVNEFLVIDTTLTIIRVWSEHRYGKCDPWILAEEQRRKYDLTLVCDIDLPWEEDPQREHPHLREHFFEVYKEHAEAHPPFAIIRGDRQARVKLALKAIQQLSGGSKPPES
ncbi:MAG: ATP-binding protein [Cyclobacteriaceae bacterium]